MPHDRYPQWAAEHAGTNRLPTAATTFLVLGLLAVLLVGLLGGLGAVIDQTGAPERAPGSFCDEKAGRPGWEQVCADTYR